MKKLINRNHLEGNIDRRGFLQCMAWAGTGVVWTTRYGESVRFPGHYLQERNHQGKDNLLLFPTSASPLAGRPRTIRCRERLGGLLKHYSRVA